MSKPLKRPLTAERLRELLHYDPETGLFTRQVTTGGRYGAQAGAVAGTKHHGGRTLISVESKRHFADRLAFLYMTGEWPTHEVRHANEQPDDDRWSNLRDEPKPEVDAKARNAAARRRRKQMAGPRTPKAGAEKYDNTRVSVELLRQRVDYDPETGALIWKACGPEHFSSERNWRIFTTRFAGKPVLKRNRGYVVVTLTVNFREQYFEGHRVAWALVTGAWPDHEIDHIDRDRGNNKWSNLRAADHMRNQWNRDLMVTNRSGFRGVHWNKTSGKWVSQIRTGNKTLHLGSFASAEQAFEARLSAEIEQRGEFSPGA